MTSSWNLTRTGGGKGAKFNIEHAFTRAKPEQTISSFQLFYNTVTKLIEIKRDSHEISLSSPTSTSEVNSEMVKLTVKKDMNRAEKRKIKNHNKRIDSAEGIRKNQIRKSDAVSSSKVTRPISIRVRNGDVFLYQESLQRLLSEFRNDNPKSAVVIIIDLPYFVLKGDEWDTYEKTFDSELETQESNPELRLYQERIVLAEKVSKLLLSLLGTGVNAHVVVFGHILTVNTFKLYL